jgi:hypothetical protein
MEGDKYSKYIVSGDRPWIQAGSGPQIASLNDEVNNGAYPESNQYHVHWVPIVPQNMGTRTWEDMGHGPHKHKYPETVMHLGTDPDHPLDLGAEVEFCLGPELEKHIITTSSVVYLPTDFIHGPWIIRKVTRPFIVVTVEQSTKHNEKSFPELVTEEERKKLLFIDQGYDSPERVVKVPWKMGREW